MTAVLLIDEDCGICVATGAWVARRSSVVVLGNDSAQAGVLLRDLPATARATAVHHVDAAGRRTTGGAAVAVALGGIPRWAWLGRLLQASPGVTAWGYRVVSRRRRLLSRMAGLRACRTPLHDPGRASDESRPAAARTPVV